jgi:YVTN family beta-propeller protein
MKMNWSAIIAGLAASACSMAPVAPPHLAIEQTFALGGPGGWDYVAVDATRGRLFVTRREHLQVVDARSGRVLGDVPGLRNAHGVALDEARGVAFVTNGGDDSVLVVDEHFAVLGRVPVTGRNPDAILFEPLREEIYAFNHSSGSITVIDAAQRKVVATIETGGKLESGVSDGKGRVYVNSEDGNEVHVVDVWARRKVASWKLGACDEPTGMAMDRPRRRLFSACKNGLMAVLDADSGRLVATVPIGKGSDGAAYDAELQLAYSSNRDGTLSVIHASGPERFDPLPALRTAEGAKTLALDAASHRIYLPVADFAPTQGGEARAPVPGTFRVMVVGAKR